LCFPFCQPEWCPGGAGFGVTLAGLLFGPKPIPFPCGYAIAEIDSRREVAAIAVINFMIGSLYIMCSREAGRSGARSEAVFRAAKVKCNLSRLLSVV
jgi:hypothetical protein